jgi:hypothetical protein
MVIARFDCANASGDAVARMISERMTAAVRPVADDFMVRSCSVKNAPRRALLRQAQPI